MFETIIAFLTDNAIALGGGAAAIAIIEKLFAPFRSIARRWKKPDKVALDSESIQQIVAQPDERGKALNDVTYFINVQKALKAELETELAEAHADEKAQLSARIAELESDIANPDEALAEAQKTIADLTARLERMGNEVGGDRLAKAREALKQFDYSVADEIFAEVEARQELAVQEAARAAYGRGEVAEAEVRWGDAAEHYARAARLEPGYDSLFNARLYSWRSGDYSSALRFGEDLVSFSERDEVEATDRLVALNEHALTLKAVGRFGEAEPLYREVIEIAKKELGNDHPHTATYLNNLAGLLYASGRSDEAEPLLREALDVRKQALGEAHPDYATSLNNLAELLRATGRYDEAEPLYREALAVTEQALGKAHPSYAIRLNNLAGLLEDTGRREEAGPLYEEALRVYEAALGPEHPNTQAVRGNLEAFRAEEG